MQNFSIEMPATLESLRIAAPFTNAVLKEIPDISGRDKLLHDLALVASEALTNALRYGKNAGTPVRLSYTLDSGGIVITVTDHGVGFDPDAVALPDFEENPEGGYGLYIMKTIMDDLRYERTLDGNNLILIKNWIGQRGT
jgi:serine/threonine-protein kinase RsbW